MRLPSRLTVSLALLSSLAACAPMKADEPADTDASDRRATTTTGSNIPKRGSAVVVDKAVIQDQINRSGGVRER